MYAANIQEAIADVLVEKSVRAIREFNPKGFVLGGGVANNIRLQERFREKLKDTETKFFVGEQNTDNAVMIAAAAFYNNNPVDWKVVSADPELAITDTLN